MPKQAAQFRAGRRAAPPRRRAVVEAAGPALVSGTFGAMVEMELPAVAADEPAAPPPRRPPLRKHKPRKFVSASSAKVRTGRATGTIKQPGGASCSQRR